MESRHQIETVILLLAAVLALTTLAQKLLIPYPILLVIGDLILGLIPGLPAIHLDPDLVFLVFLPSILWAPPISRCSESFETIFDRSPCWR